MILVARSGHQEKKLVWSPGYILKETRVRTAHAAHKMLLCRLEAAKRHLKEGKIFAHCP